MKKLVILITAALMTLSFATYGFSLKKDIEFKAVGDEGKVTFSHEFHTEKQGLKCNECHPKLFKMKKGGDDMTMAAMKEGKFCGACHNGKKAFSVADEANCAKCHKK